MPNILTAIKAIIKDKELVIKNITGGNNRVNDMGEGLENYIKYAFSDTLKETNKSIRLQKISEVFSYLGNKNNPPDMMLRNQEAIEVKKIESAKSSLQLNSSHPKSKLHVTNNKINKACKKCEDWQIKDLIYSIGHIPKRTKYLQSLWFVYGDCYAADDETYQKVESKIKNSINSIGDLEINDDTEELSRIKNVDPLNISDLRVRGMWIIENPTKVYEYIYEYDKNAKFQLIALMKKDKYEKFPVADRDSLKCIKNLEIKDVNIQNPNNPANLIEAKLIIFKVL